MKHQKTPKAFESGSVKFETLKDLLAHLGFRSPDRIALSTLSGEFAVDISYEQLQRSAHYLGNAMIGSGIEKGCKMGILSENRPEWVVAFLAAASLGIILVPMDIHYGLDDLKDIADNVEIDIFFTSDRYIETIQKLQTDLECSKPVVCFDMVDLPDGLSTKAPPFPAPEIDPAHLGALCREHPPCPLLEDGSVVQFDHVVELGRSIFKKFNLISRVALKGDDILALVHTGEGSFAVLSHKGVMENLNAINALNASGYYDSPGTVLLATLPFHHMFPLMSQVLMPLSCHFRIIISESRKVLDMVAMITQYRANIIPVVPLILEQMAGYVINYGTLSDSVRHFICGGAPVKTNVINRLEQFGIPVIQGYGLTEYSPVVSVNTPNSNIPGSVGKPLPNVQVRLVDLDKDGNGELLVKGPSMMMGYYNNQSKTRSVIDDSGWLHTGDIARIDNEGFLFITGRVKRLIVNKGGKNIYPMEIERILKQSSLVSEAIIVPKIDETFGEIPHAIIVPYGQKENVACSHTGTSIDEKAFLLSLENDLRQRTKHRASYKLPASYEISDTASLKEIQESERFIFSEYYLDEGLQKTVKNLNDGSKSSSSQNTDENVISLCSLENFCIDQLAEILSVEHDNVDPMADFLDLLDSIQLVKLGNRVEKQFGIALDPVLLFEYTSIRRLSEYLLAEYSPPPSKFPSLPQKNETVSPNTDKGLYVSTGRYLKSDIVPIAIIGVGGLFPKSITMDELWGHLENCDDLISEIPEDRWDWRDARAAVPLATSTGGVKWGGFIDDVAMFDSNFFRISPHEASRMDPQQRLFLETAWKTIEDAGYAPSALSGSRTSVFVGVATMDYHEKLIKSGILPDGYTAIGNAHCIIANRISHFFNFQGASESINTACSSSLTAIHRGVESIWSGACDLALAGGVNLLLSPDLFTSFDRAGMLSPNGRCKAFDADADGYVRGEGVGALLLKRLVDSESDGDTIYAVIRGSGVNHTGHANSLTAPNPESQARLLMSVYRKADVDVTTVSYMEAHGTGTPLGDPVEIEGLNRAFSKLINETGRPATNIPYCGVGSVKTNMGHLEAAAGVAGVIKVILAMRNKTLPGNVHWKTLNPYINLAKSPFYIVKDTQPWTCMLDYDNKEIPRRAGISSFGFGGSNAHIILEEYRQETDECIEHCGQKQVFVLSAGSHEILLNYAKIFLEYLDNCSRSVSLSDIIYTLQIGRDPFEFRLAAVVITLDELIQKLREFSSGELHIADLYVSDSKKNKADKRTSTDGRDLKEDLKRRSPDHSPESLAKAWVAGERVDWENIYRFSKPKRVPLPGYPFYKIRHWIPENDGESGAFKNSDLPPMKGLSLFEPPFSEKKPLCLPTVFKGDDYRFTDHRVFGRYTLPGAVFLEMVLSAANCIKGAGLHIIKDFFWARPVILKEGPVTMETILSPLDGTSDYKFQINRQCSDNEVISTGKIIVLTQEDLIEEELHELLDIPLIRNRCGEMLSSSTCYEIFSRAGLEYGSGFRTILGLRHNKTEALSEMELPPDLEYDFTNHRLHPSLIDGAFQTVMSLLEDKYSSLLYLPFGLKEVICHHPLKNKCCAYAVQTDEPKKIKGCKTFDICITDEAGKILIRLNGLTVKAAQAQFPKEPSIYLDDQEGNNNVYYFSYGWKKDLLEPPSESRTDSTAMIFLCKREYGTALADVGNDFHDFPMVFQGNHFRQIAEQTFEIDQSVREQYFHLLKTLSKSQRFPESIILISNGSGDMDIQDSADVSEYLNSSLYIVFNLCQALMEIRPDSRVRLIYAYHAVTGLYSAFDKAVAGFGKSLMLENPRISLSTLKLTNPGKRDTDRILLEVSLQELCYEHTAEVWYDRAQRNIRLCSPVNSHKLSKRNQTPLVPNGIYLITGGSGVIAGIIANAIAEKVQATLVLTGKSEMSSETKKRITAIESMGSNACYYKMDLSDNDSIKTLFNTIRQEFGGLNGLIHCAGNLNDSLVVGKTLGEVRQTLEPKVDGTIYLDTMTKDEKLDFFILFSSIASVTGNIGQSDYAYANRFLDAFAEARCLLVNNGKRSGKTISINWPFWQEGGMTVDKKILDHMEKQHGLSPLSTRDAIDAFHKVLSLDLPRVIIASGNGEKIATVLSKNDSSKSEFPVMPCVEISNRSSSDEHKTRRELIDYFTGLLATSTGLSESDIEPDEPFEDFGIDSVMIVELTRRVEAFFSIELSKTLFFEHPDINQLSSYFLKHYPHEIERVFHMDTPCGKSSQGASLEDRELNNLEKFQVTAPQVIVKSKEMIQPQLDHLSCNVDAIAIVGLSGRYPDAETVEEFWQNLSEGKDCVRMVPENRWDTGLLSNLEGDPNEDIPGFGYGGFIQKLDQFDPAFFNISYREAQLMDPQERLFLESVWHTLEDAGYTRKSLQDKTVGVFVGAMWGHYQLFSTDCETDRMGKHVIHPGAILGSIANRVSYFFNFRGPSLAIDTMCSSSLTAIHMACESIRRGECDCAIAGGVNITVHPNKYALLDLGGFLSNDGRCRSFGNNGSGYVPGEGVGSVMLKPFHAAQESKDNIYGIILGSSVNHGGRSNGYSVPNPARQGDLILDVLKKAQVDPRDISYVEAHGTGTALGDPIEITGLNQAFSKYRGENDHVKQYCSIGSVKSNIGHLEAASGIAGLTKVLMQMKYKRLVPSLHTESLNEDINFKESPFFVQRRLTEWNRPKRIMNGYALEGHRIAGLSSFGAGGANAHMILQEYQRKVECLDRKNSGQRLIVISAKNIHQLNKNAEALLCFLKEGIQQAVDSICPDLHTAPQNLMKIGRRIVIDDLAYTLQVGREEMDERLALVVHDIDDLKQKLFQYLSTKRSGPFVYHGRVKAMEEKSLLLSDVLCGENLLDSLIKNKQLEKIAKLWILGVPIEWSRLWQETQTPYRISLPVYCFERKPFWISPVDASPAASKGLLDETVVSASDQPQPDHLNSGYDLLKDTLVTIVSNRTAYPYNEVTNAFHEKITFKELGIDSIISMEILGDITTLFPELQPKGDELILIENFDSLLQFMRDNISIHSNGQQFKKEIEQNGHHLSMSNEDKPENSVCTSVKVMNNDPLELKGFLVINDNHPFFFDHFLDHVSGLQLTAAMQQLCLEAFDRSLPKPEQSSLFQSYVRVSFNSFCKKDPNDTVVQCRAEAPVKEERYCFLSEVRQDGASVSEGKFIYHPIPDTDKDNRLEYRDISEKLLSHDFSPCDAEIVNKRNPDNVFISEIHQSHERLGCWVLPLESKGGFMDIYGMDMEHIDPVYIIEACRQGHRAAEYFRRIHRNGSDVETPLKNNGMMLILKSVELRLSIPISHRDKVWLEIEKEEMTRIGKNILVYGKTRIIVGKAEIGRFEIRYMILANTVYKHWRSDGIQSPLNLKND